MWVATSLLCLLAVVSLYFYFSEDELKCWLPEGCESTESESPGEIVIPLPDTDGFTTPPAVDDDEADDDEGNGHSDDDGNGDDNGDDDGNGEGNDD